MKFCIHGHFYQPPREDPISHKIPNERGAAPYQNWNERITAECYTPNAEVGNFGKISFNIGPTLFQWLCDNTPETAKMIIAQERDNYESYGVGNAMAQSYNHSILPLESYVDKITQVRWGIEEFKFRYGHAPQGMWLPETAADIETLCVLSDEGLTFTILAPWQIRAKSGQGPYKIPLPGNRKPFIVFPYDQEYSTMISFMPKSTENGDHFLREMKRKRLGNGAGINVFASDGELYGHHQQFRDLFLNYILGLGSKHNGIEWTYPGLYLQENEVLNEAELVEPSSWSCLHGVDRWTAECSCTPGARWKAPLRRALRAVADWIDAYYLACLNVEASLAWELRHRYIEVMLGICDLNILGIELFGEKWQTMNHEKVALLLASQLERQKMFTSCGWFFDDLNRIEPANNIAYAAKAVWLCQQACGGELDSSILDVLAEAKSPQTGLQADEIFLATLERAEKELSA